MYEVQVEKFTGPLDLLLQLIEQQKLEITEIYLGQVTDQYLAHIEKIEDKDPEELADFLVLAARLLLLKSKALLPEIEEEENLDDLQKQLKMYKEFQDAAKKIEAILHEQKFSFSREKLPINTEVEFSPPVGLQLSDLKSAILTVLKKLDPLVHLPRQAIERSISLQQKISEIKEFLLTQHKFGFKKLMSDAKSKTEVIVNFLAVLELVKSQHLRVRQASLFDDIMLERM